MSQSQMIQNILKGDKKSLAKAMTLVCSHLEEDKIQAQALLEELLTARKSSYRIGVSGIGGVGKSTFIEALGSFLIRKEKSLKLGILAIDPSSPKGGGSILADFVRMESLVSSDRVFIRSVSNSGLSGGLNHQAQELVFLLEAAGCDYIIIESVGSGQADTDISNLCDAFVNLQMPASGDAMQAIKKGGVELSDFIVIHKNDGLLKEEAQKAESLYKQAHSLQKISQDRKLPQVVLVSSLECTGINKLWDLILEHKSVQAQEGNLEKKRSEQIFEIFKAQIALVFRDAFLKDKKFSKLIEKSKIDLESKQTTPLLAARKLVHSVLRKYDSLNS